MSESADAWVTPDQMAALHPTTTQMLYRFTHAATDAEISSGQSAVTAGLPSGALLGFPVLPHPQGDRHRRSGDRTSPS